MNSDLKSMLRSLFTNQATACMLFIDLRVSVHVGVSGCLETAAVSRRRQTE